MMPRPEAFDRDIPLADLLRGVPPAKLDAVMARTLGQCWRIADANGQTIRQSSSPMPTDAVLAPLRIDIEVVGHIQAPQARQAHAVVASTWLEMVLAGAMRYRMAADLHLETVHADFEALQAKHAALLESEARYRDLAAQLEQRVKAQVGTIERTQRQLYQSEKMAAVGTLAAGMAHEINNPLGFIRSNLGTATIYLDTIRKMLAAFRSHGDPETSSLWRKLDMDFLLEDFTGLLDESTAGADRVSRIVANLKAYASIDCTDGTPVDMNGAVRAAAGILQDQLPPDVQLEMDLQPLPPVSGDASRLNQVLFSLLQNARLALPEGGGLIHVASGMAGNAVRVAVRDNGCGMAAETVGRIFDPFFTTRDVGKGMGLGLTVSRDILNAHGGRIEVDTSLGAGTTFTIYLPVASDAIGAGVDEERT